MTFLIILVAGFLFFYKVDVGFRMSPYYNYDSDFGRDLLKMTEILHGKQTLIGPQLSFAGLRLAPYQFYFFAPFLWLGRFDYRSVVFANAGLFVLGFFLLFFLLQKRIGRFYSFLSILWLISTPYIILTARSPGNGFSYVILLLLVVFLHFFYKSFSLKQHFLFGFIEGIIINFHPLSSLIVVPLHLLKLKKAKDFFVFAFGLLITFLSVFIFDLRHDFVIINFFINGGQKNFFTVLTQFLNFSSFLKGYTADSYQGAIHYYFPFLVFFQVVIIFLNRKSRLRFLLLAFLLGVNILLFPFRFYNQARNLGEVESRFNKIISQDFLQKKDLNIVLINDTPISKVGYEYRFLLSKNNYQIDDEYSYHNSKYLLMISEIGDLNWQKEKSWELEQFGNKKLIKKTNSDNYFYYFFEKTY